MAPDGGQLAGDLSVTGPPSEDRRANSGLDAEMSRRHNEDMGFLALHAHESQNFTLRGILVGLGVGLIVCFSNMYFGLQTGWVSSMSMPSSLIGFAFFRSLSKHLDLPFTPVENVLVQTVAGSMGTMPLGCGFVGVMPALNYMLSSHENGPLFLSLWKLVLWALGLCFFGVVFAVPLRRQVIIREKLKFPSGTATALMIGVLHGKLTKGTSFPGDQEYVPDHDEVTNAIEGLNSVSPSDTDEELFIEARDDVTESIKGPRDDWKARVRLLLISFVISGLYTFATYFFPVLRSLPIFGLTLAQSWLWTLNPSLAYVGQGIIMGPATAMHMLVGAIVGWGVLSPLARAKGWAPGPVNDWETGSKGWIVWVSLAIMLADSVISLGFIASQPLYHYGILHVGKTWKRLVTGHWEPVINIGQPENGYTPVNGEGFSTPLTTRDSNSNLYDSLDHTSAHSPIAICRESMPDADAPPEHLIGNRVVWFGLLLSIVFCIISISIVFGILVPLYATITAVFVALILSIMGVRALGETDLNPVSGISKLAQLFFALIIPQSNKNSVLINLIAGAVSEAGALQAGDLMQDLKTGHLLGAAPKAQFWGQIIGSAVGAVISALIYRLYTSVYTIPGDLFQVPTGYVWIFTARLVTGKGLPSMVWQWALGAAILFTVTTSIRIAGSGKSWHPYIPGGIAVAIGMYNVPSFTLARSIGGILNWYWLQHLGREETPIVILASGLVLGEGVVSIVNLLMASLKIPHL
ncbi:MAG: hypothetical protein M1818_000852 [Claussenomyces sp. TS43310]|nr:MAG: hypothetical protein M1818_000852 [Claussenomyces sp. TS43310]